MVTSHVGRGGGAQADPKGEIQCIMGNGHMWLQCEQTDTHDRKRYLPAISLAGGYKPRYEGPFDSTSLS